MPHRAHEHTPEQRRIVHPLGHEVPLVLQLLAQLLERVLLCDGEVPEAPGERPVVGVCDALRHRARAGGLRLVCHDDGGGWGYGAKCGG